MERLAHHQRRDPPRIQDPTHPEASFDLPAGDRALFGAIRDNNFQAMCQILDAGADINARGERGTTPVMVAALYGHKDMLNELMKRGADRMARDNDSIPVDQYIDSFGAFSIDVRAQLMASISKSLLMGIASTYASAPKDADAES